MKSNSRSKTPKTARKTPAKKPTKATRAIDAPIALIAGLGNPGKQYADTRHNVGLRLVARLCRLRGVQLTAQKRFSAEVGELRVGERIVRVLASSVYMNLSGRAVAPLAGFYRIQAAQTLIVHDEIEFAPGVVRLKIGGGLRGHNGLRDIAAQLGSRDFIRLQIGVGHPGKTRDVAGYVLSKPTAQQSQCIDRAIDDALEVIDDILDRRIDAVGAAQ